MCRQSPLTIKFKNCELIFSKLDLQMALKRLQFGFKINSVPLWKFLTLTNAPFENPRRHLCCVADSGGKTNKDGESTGDTYPQELSGYLNKQIQAEMNAAMVYLSMSCYYGRTSVAQPGAQAFFKNMYFEEQGHAMEFIDYQLLRGGEVKLYPITAPKNFDWETISLSLGVALEMEKSIVKVLECLLEIAEKYDDIQLIDLIGNRFITEQNRSLCEIGRLFTRSKDLEESGKLGEYLFDRELFEVYVREGGKNHKKYM